MRSQREVRIAFDDQLFETRTPAGRPPRRPVHDAVPDWSAVPLRSRLARPGNAHELALHPIRAQPEDGVAVAAHVQEGQMRREIRVRQPSRGSRVAGALIFEAGTNAVMQQQVHRRFLLPGHIRDV